MRKKTITVKGVYDFLEESGLLEYGTDEQITEAKKQYWNRIKREWKKQRLQNHKRVEIYLNSQELTVIRKIAANCNTSITKYIKQLILQPSHGIPEEFCGQVRQSLLRAHFAVYMLLEEHNVPPDVNEAISRQLRISESEVLRLLRPKNFRRDH